MVIRVAALANVVGKGVVQHVCLRVEQGDSHDFSLEDIAYLITDDARHRLDIKGLGHRFADAVEDGQFANALLLRFKEARILNGHAHIGREGLQQPHIVAIIRFLAVALQRHEPQDLSLTRIGTPR